MTIFVEMSLRRFAYLSAAIIGFLLSGLNQVVHAQRSFEFTITFGMYTNDHWKHEFHVEERTWKLKGGSLSYSIDAHDTRYVDTIALPQRELDSLRLLIVAGNLNQTVRRSLDAKYNDKWEVRQEIRGEIRLNGVTHQLDLRGEGYSALEDDPLAKAADALEQLLWRIVERNGAG